MKIQIPRNELFRLISPIQSLVEKRNVSPILSKVLLDVSENQFQISSTDQNNSLQCITDLKGKKGATCVDSRNFFEIIKELPEGMVTLSKPASKEGLEIKSHLSVFNMVGVPASNFPVFPTLKNPTFFKMKASEVCSLIDQTSYCVSTDGVRYHLNGVLFEKNKNMIRMVATDGHRLSYGENPNEEIFKIRENIIIPQKGLQEIYKLLSSEEEKQVSIAIHHPRIVVKFLNFLLSIRLIEGEYPNYEQLIPKSSTVKIVINREILIQSLRRVSILSSMQSKNVLFDWNKSSKNLTLSTSNPELGDAKEEVPIESINRDLKIRFNARYVLDSLNHIKDKEVILEMNTSSTSGMIKGKTSRGVSIIMPMKL